MSKNYKNILTFIAFLIIIFTGLAIYTFLIKKDVKEKIEVNVVDEIKDYGYSINSLDSKYYKELFEQLKTILKADEIDKEAYAKVVAELFVVDLYTIDTKVNKYDVGGDQYYHADKLYMYKKKVVETFYELVKDNSYGDRKQELPVVSNIEVVDYKTATYKLGEEEVPSYVVTLKWSYEKDLGYDQEGIVTLVDNGNKIEVVEFGQEEQQ